MTSPESRRNPQGFDDSADPTNRLPKYMPGGGGKHIDAIFNMLSRQLPTLPWQVFLKWWKITNPQLENLKNIEVLVNLQPSQHISPQNLGFNSLPKGKPMDKSLFFNLFRWFFTEKNWKVGQKHPRRACLVFVACVFFNLSFWGLTCVYHLPKKGGCGGLVKVSAMGAIWWNFIPFCWWKNFCTSVAAGS